MPPSDPDPDPDRSSSLFAEIGRRRVFRVAGAYVLVAWVLMQAGEIVFPAFELPNSALRFLILSLVAGLPCVIFLAWVLDVTPRGIRFTRKLRGRLDTGEGDGSEEGSGLGRSLEMVLLGVGIPIFAFAMLLFFFMFRGAGETTEDTFAREGAPTTGEFHSLAVLPFEDLSIGGDDAGFFARGMHEDILTHLARLRPLKLISRTSVMAYEGTTQNVRAIGRELGVDHILEGSVRRTPTSVRVTVQLIRTETDEHVWAENFDAELEDVFGVQTRIAQAVASALEAELVPGASSGAVPALSSVVPAAYDAYLKARDIHRNLDAENRDALARARHLYETALRNDGTLASAWLQLGILHAQAYWFGFDSSPKRAELSRDCIANARKYGAGADQLALTEGILAYYVDRDSGKALLHFAEVARLAPGNAEANFYRAMILRRSGELDQALAAQKSALELDPLNFGYRDEYAFTLALAGRLVDARDELRDILRSDPNRLRAQVQKWQLDLELDGQPRRLLDEILTSPRNRWRDQHYAMLETVSILAGQPDVALAIVSQRPVPSPDSGYLDFQLATLEGFLGHSNSEKERLARSRAKLERLVTESPGVMRAVDRRRVEAMFFAQGGEFASAIALLSLNVAAQPIERDLIVGGAPLWLLLHVQIEAGQIDDAIETIRRFRSQVALGSVLYGGHFVLARWPEFEAARADPRFASFLEEIRPGYASGWPAAD